ncbi:MAG: M20 family metallopeptidase [Bacteroidota bacterium]|nr:M20 family metallopeptidase [Bacteroidota bacterium]
MIKQRVFELSKSIKQEVIQHRQKIHQNPELSFQEFQTADYVENYLKSLGLVPNRISSTGVWAMIEGSRSGKTVALRADLDALPIKENSNKNYASKNEGVMHACGHDAHTASLLGAAKILVNLKDELKGQVKLIFQPGEEKFPGGASLLIKEGVLENPKVDCIIGQHVMPLINRGNVGFRKGLYMASTDEIYIKVIGKGGHGAMPQFCVDPVMVAATILVNLQQIVSRKAPPIIPTVLSFGKIESKGGATNIIPNEVNIEGTLRTLNEEWRAKAKEHIVDIARQTAESFGAKAIVDIKKGYPFLKNDDQFTDKLKISAQEYLGEEQVEDLDIWMAAEDFSYYSQEIPACFYRLGTRNESKGIVNSVHTDSFDIDEDALEIGSGLMAYLAIMTLEQQ